jgi:hypothetical protein
MGDSNSIGELQNYVAGVGSNGFVLTGTGALDMQKVLRASIISRFA